jgi:hypothetical protein
MTGGVLFESEESMWLDSDACSQLTFLCPRHFETHAAGFLEGAVPLPSLPHDNLGLEGRNWPLLPRRVEGPSFFETWTKVLFWGPPKRQQPLCLEGQPEQSAAMVQKCSLKNLQYIKPTVSLTNATRMHKSCAPSFMRSLPKRGGCGIL